MVLLHVEPAYGMEKTAPSALCAACGSSVVPSVITALGSGSGVNVSVVAFCGVVPSRVVFSDF